MLSRAGVKYLRGSNSPGFSANALRIAAVIAKRLSESILILHTADLADLDAYLIQCCAERHQRLDGDTPLVAEFWELYHYLEDELGCKVNHSRDETRIAISLLDFVQQLAEHKLRPLDLPQLRQELKQSKRYKLVEANHPILSKLKNKTVKCFVFTKQGTVSALGQIMAA